MKVRTRVAPSPTGDPHVGTAYMALFSMCFAHSQGGQFLLRIEDTDAARSTAESEQKILDSLKWLGLEWDEGPDVGGEYGPYRQSERRELYRKQVDRLLEDGHAFHCFCTSERLDEMRKEQMAKGETARYDGRCALLEEKEVAEQISREENFVVRMKVPSEGVCTVNDLLRGDIEIDYSQVDMQVLLKSDGNPTYHLAVVVDDHLMKITHVIRGEEWINSAPKHILLYDYLGWDMPQLIHMPLLRNPDKSKLSKRKNPTSIGFYKSMGFLPEAVLNYLGMLGWSMPDGEEKFSVQQMMEQFDISRISLGAPVFDVDKLKWLNGRWLREELDEDQFVDKLIQWSYNRDQLKKIIPLIRERVDIFSQVAPMTAYLYEGLPVLNEADFETKNIAPDLVKKVLQFVLWRLEAESDWSRDNLQQILADMATSFELKLKDFLSPLFIAISGKPVSPPLFDSMVILGADMVRARLRHALGVLGGVSKKQGKKLEKEYRVLGAEKNT